MSILPQRLAGLARTTLLLLLLLLAALLLVGSGWHASAASHIHASTSAHYRADVDPVPPGH